MREPHAHRRRARGWPTVVRDEGHVGGFAARNGARSASASRYGQSSVGGLEEAGGDRRPCRRHREAAPTDRRGAGRRGARPGRSTDSAHITSGPRSTATHPRTASMRGSGAVQRGVIGSVRVTSSPTANGRSTTAVPGGDRAPSRSVVGELCTGRPRRHPQAQRPRLAVGLGDAHRDGRRRRDSRGRHLDADAAAAVEGRGDAAVGVLVDLDPGVVGGGQVGGEAGQRAGDVRRAAGDEEPRLAQARRRPLALDVARSGTVPRHTLVQRVGVEEVPAVRAPATWPRRCTACAR